MNAAKQLNCHMGLRKTLTYTDTSKRVWYYKSKRREIELDQSMVDAVKRISTKRPTYGTRRMTAQISRETGTPVNRKRIQRIYRKIGYIQSQKTKKDTIIHTNRRLFKSKAPNRLWGLDITYIWCGIDGWCYCFNVIDCFTRKWIAYVFETSATRHEAMESITKAIAAENPDCSRLRIRTDNGNQYTSRDFGKTVEILGIHHEFIWKNTPEQNGHIESFHNTLKKEYIWPREFNSYQEAEAALANAFEDYNNCRIHSAIGYVPPAEFAAQWKGK